MIAIGESERLVIPVGEVKASRSGKKFTYRNPTVPRGIRMFQMRRLKDDSNGIQRYRVRFSLVGIDLSGLLIEFPLCKSLAVIVGDDDGFSGRRPRSTRRFLPLEGPGPRRVPGRRNGPGSDGTL